MYGPTVFGHFDTFEPFRKSFDYILLKKSRFTNATMKSFHRDRTATNVLQHHRSDRFIIGCQITLIDSIGGKKNLLRVTDQGCSFTTWRASVFELIPSKRGCRSFPLVVHSMKPTRTTI